MYMHVCVTGIVPTWSGLWWLAVFLLKDLSDTYQLANFVVSHESSKFFSAILSLLVGATRYFICVNFANFECDSFGPRIADLDMLMLTIQTALAFVTFRRFAVWASLPSHRKRNTIVTNSYSYHFACTCVACILAVLIYVLARNQSYREQSLYWLRVIYFMTSAPFVVFKLPLIDQLMITAAPTGYNHAGKVVPRKQHK